MMSIGTVFIFLALILFVLAGLNVPKDGPVQCQWLAFACLCAAVLAGRLPLTG